MIHGLKHLLSDALQETAPDLESAVLTPFLKVLSYKTFFLYYCKVLTLYSSSKFLFQRCVRHTESSILTPPFISVKGSLEFSF